MPLVNAIYEEVKLQEQQCWISTDCVHRGCTLKPFQVLLSCGRGTFGMRRRGRSDLRKPGVPLVAGPTHIQTLLGDICGRQVALILCGEAHEDAMDLTRKESILEPNFGWVPTDQAFHLGRCSTKSHATLQVAKMWAAKAMAGDGGLLVFQLQDAANGTGTARVFKSNEMAMKRGRAQENVQHFLWKDLDADIRMLQDKKQQGQKFCAEEHDALVAERKQRLAKEGVELFDDWLIRAGRLVRPVEIILEAPLPASQVELHEEGEEEEAPVADAVCQSMELDSGEEELSLQEKLGMRPMRSFLDEGSLTFLEYLRRRLSSQLPSSRIHSFDVRDLGSPDDAEMKKEYQQLWKAEVIDPEEQRLQDLGLEVPVAVEAADRPVPSWEAFFGAATELLYYSPHVRADYVPFLACVMKPPPPNLSPKDWILKFFEHLYCGVVSDAVAMLRTDGRARGFLRLRSSLHWDGQRYRRRQEVRAVVPVSTVPLKRFLKAKGSGEPRTWVSGLADRLACGESAGFVAQAHRWYLEEVQGFLTDVKANDMDGDHFAGFLREARRDIFDDIDAKNHCTMAHVPSVSQNQKFYDLRGIQIPNFDEALQEILSFDPGTGQVTGRRQRVLAKIIIDVFQLRMVDLASILLIMDRAMAFPKGSEVVVVMYAGSDHSYAVERFYRSVLGFSAEQLPRKGRLGKDRYGPRESRGLRFPSYLYDFRELFQST